MFGSDRFTPAGAQIWDSPSHPDFPKTVRHNTMYELGNGNTAVDNWDVEKQPPTRVDDAPIDPGSFPDGGLKAWMVVFGGFCGMLVSFGWINCIGVFQNYYQLNQLSSYSPSSIAWIPALETCMMFVTAPICGKLYDNFGPRYLVLGGSVLHVFGLLTTSFSSEYYQFILAQGICSAVGAGALFYASMNSVTSWFYSRRAFALGIVASGSSVGGVTLPIMVQRLMSHFGFEWAMRSCAALICALCVVANFTIKSRIPPQPKSYRFADYIAHYKELPFFFTGFAVFIMNFGLFLPYNFIIVQGRRYGMSPDLARYLVPILNAGSTLGRILPAWAADRIGRFNTMVIVCYFASILVLALWIPAQNNAAIITFAALFGVGGGGFVSLQAPLIAQISDVRQIGVRSGAIFLTSAFGALTGNPIGGALIENVSSGSFWRMQLFAGITMLVGSTSFLFARVTVGGWKLKKNV